MPYTDQGLPFASSRFSEATEASLSGARHAAEHRGRQTQAYLELLRARGPLTDQEAAICLGCGLSSICSIRNGVRDQVQPCGFETHAFSQGRATKRMKWALR